MLCVSELSWVSCCSECSQAGGFELLGLCYLRMLGLTGWNPDLSASCLVSGHPPEPTLCQCQDTAARLSLAHGRGSWQPEPVSSSSTLCVKTMTGIKQWIFGATSSSTTTPCSQCDSQPVHSMLSTLSSQGRQQPPVLARRDSSLEQVCPVGWLR